MTCSRGVLHLELRALHRQTVALDVFSSFSMTSRARVCGRTVPRPGVSPLDRQRLPEALAVLEGQALGARVEPRCLVRPGVSVDALRISGLLSRAAGHDRAGRYEALVEHGQRREWHVEDLE